MEALSFISLTVRDGPMKNLPLLAAFIILALSLFGWCRDPSAQAAQTDERAAAGSRASQGLDFLAQRRLVARQVAGQLIDL